MKTTGIEAEPMSPVQIRAITLLSLSHPNIIWISLEQAEAIEYAISLLTEGVQDYQEAFIRKLSVATVIYQTGYTDKSVVEETTRTILETMEEWSK